MNSNKNNNKCPKYYSRRELKERLHKFNIDDGLVGVGFFFLLKSNNLYVSKKKYIYNDIIF